MKLIHLVMATAARVQGSQYGNDWEPWMEGNPAYQFVDGEIHCVKHTEILPENITSLQASAQLNPESQAWIVNDLAGKYYEAYVHNPQFNLVPGMAQPTGGCSGDQVCSAEALVTNVPFADPGTFDLRTYISTSGTSFTLGRASPSRSLNPGCCLRRT